MSVVQVEEGEVAVEHSACCTGGTELGQSELGPGVGFEAVQRTAPSGCGTESPEAEASESGGGRVRGSGQGRRVTGWDAALWASAEPVWVLQACWSDLVSEADCRCPPLLPADLQAGREDQESRAVQRTEAKLHTFQPAELTKVSIVWIKLAYCVGWGLLKTWRGAVSQCRHVSTFCLCI